MSELSEWGEMTNWLLCHLPFRPFFTPAVVTAAAAAIELSWHCRSGGGAAAPVRPTGRLSSIVGGEREGGSGGECESDVRLSGHRPPCRLPSDRASPICFSFAFVFSRLLLIARHQLHLASIRPPPPSVSQRRRKRSASTLTTKVAPPPKEV